MLSKKKEVNMSMIRWDPAKDLMSLRQAMDKLFEESFIRPSGFTLEIGGGSIPIDIYQNENNVVVKATLPGVRPEEVDISVTGNILTIKAERKEEKETQEKTIFEEKIDTEWFPVQWLCRPKLKQT
jgi:HSP20 family protein